MNIKDIFSILCPICKSNIKLPNASVSISNNKIVVTYPTSRLEIHPKLNYIRFIPKNSGDPSNLLYFCLKCPKCFTHDLDFLFIFDNLILSNDSRLSLKLRDQTNIYKCDFSFKTKHFLINIIPRSNQKNQYDFPSNISFPYISPADPTFDTQIFINKIKKLLAIS